MTLRNNIRQQIHRRQIAKTFNDAPPHVDIKQSVKELRRIYPEMTNKQFSKWYQNRYHIHEDLVLSILDEDIDPT